MGTLLFIDSDDIETLSEALKGALERRGINFGAYGIGDDEEEDDIDPYLGILPHAPRKHNIGGLTIDNDDEPFPIGGCGVCHSGSYCGGSTYTPHYGGCGGGGCGYTPSYGGCGGSRC